MNKHQIVDFLKKYLLKKKKKSSFAKFKSSSSIKQSRPAVLSTGDTRLGLLLAGSLDYLLPYPFVFKMEKEKILLKSQRFTQTICRQVPLVLKDAPSQK